MKAASQRGVGAAQRRQPAEPERDRDDADQEADQGVAEEAARAGAAASRPRPGRRCVVSMPVELVTPTVYGSSSTHWNGTTIVLERRRPSAGRPVEPERNDRVVDRDARDRELRRAAGSSPGS